MTDASSPLGALEHFYRAFNGRDLSSMAASWLTDGDIVMANPLGDIRRGWQAIEEVYKRLFLGPARLSVTFSDYTLHQGGPLFYATGREHGVVTAPTQSFDVAIRTTRIFRLSDDAWRQTHHHGSIDEPDILKRYQDIFG